MLVQLDDWVLCRLYNKKNEWEKMQLGKTAVAGVGATKEEAMAMATSPTHSHAQSHSHSWVETRTPESEIV